MAITDIFDYSKYQEQVTKTKRQLAELYAMSAAHFSVQELSTIMKGAYYQNPQDIDEIYNRVKLNEVKGWDSETK